MNEARPLLSRRHALYHVCRGLCPLGYRVQVEPGTNGRVFWRSTLGAVRGGGALGWVTTR